jgi:hypothetical protein
VRPVRAADYRNTLAPTPWIFRGDVNKPLLVLLAMLAVPIAIGLLVTLL